MYTFYISSAIGICLILKYGTILNTFRAKTSAVFPILNNLYKCCLCMGFWIGLILSFYVYEIDNYGVENVLFPFAVSFWAFLSDSIITMIFTIVNYFTILSSEKSAPNK